MKKIFAFFGSLFSKLAASFRLAMIKGKEFLKKEIPAAMNVVESIKSLVENPATALLTNLIPGDVDDKIVGILKVRLPQVLLSLQLVRDTANLQTNNDIIQAVIKRLQEMPKADRKGKYLEIAAKLSEYLTDSKLTWGELIKLVQTAYDVDILKN